MSTPRPFALAALSFAAAVTLLPSWAAHAQDEHEPGVFIVGDSHVQMLGPMLTRRLREDGFRALGHEARPGWSTARYRRAGDLHEVLEAAGRPEVVVVSLGGNDIVGSREAYRAQIEWVLEQARAGGARKIVWIGPATSNPDAGEVARVVGARHERNAELQRDILSELGVAWIDSRPVTVSHHGRDGIHFGRTGYATWSDGVLGDIEAHVRRFEAAAEALA